MSQEIRDWRVDKELNERETPDRRAAKCEGLGDVLSATVYFQSVLAGLYTIKISCSRMCTRFLSFRVRSTLNRLISSKLNRSFAFNKAVFSAWTF